MNDEKDFEKRIDSLAETNEIRKIKRCSSPVTININKRIFDRLIVYEQIL